MNIFKRHGFTCPDCGQFNEVDATSVGACECVHEAEATEQQEREYTEWKRRDLIERARVRPTPELDRAKRADALEKIRAHLGACIVQRIPSDDGIIFDHIVTAYELAGGRP